VTENGRHDAAALAARQDLGIPATRGNAPTVAAEQALVHARLGREDRVAHVELADAEAGADLSTRRSRCPR